MFNVKFDKRRKARLVAGTHRIVPPADSCYDRVDEIYSERLELFLEVLNSMVVFSDDCSTAKLHRVAPQKYSVIVQPEFEN